MSLNLLDTDTHVNGNLSCKTLSAPAGSITNAAIAAAAGIDATKVVHQVPYTYTQLPGTAVLTETKLLHTCRAATTLVAIDAAVITVATGADRTVTIDVKYGNAGTSFTTVLSSTIVLDNTNVARVPEDGTLSVTSLADGDIIEIIVTVAGAAGNQAQGLIVTLWAREAAQ